MQIIRGLINLNFDDAAARQQDGAIVTIGNYDGIHLGHQEILSKVRALAAQHNLPTILVTFAPQPREYFLQQRCNHHLLFASDAAVSPGSAATPDAATSPNAVAPPDAITPSPQPTCCRLMTWREKIMLLRDFGIDKLLILHFNDALARLPANDFVREVLAEKLHAKYVVVGEDFMFGAREGGRGGDVDMLQKCEHFFGFQTISIPDFRFDGDRVSSSLIRKSLQHGDLAAAQRFLGRPYSVMGRIIDGDKRGRDLGFPTANISVHHKIIPFSGVYAVRVWLYDLGVDSVQQKLAPLHGVANIGLRPTLTSSPSFSSDHPFPITSKRLLEFHIFDFNQNIYGKIAKVEFMHKLREEQKFASLSELQQQIARDAAAASEFFAG